ncbi:DNRLRE domain-containing protein [Streptacidiphilus fuscans]|uniref:DNRLRE domain-containing protein n=1 Tax=Streptacidiphilus fuscans TaxID=2789292 RepID=A0A931BC38_9ACTN|nr:DNRLRE domain-containing protein [Streptacidiphilus fuscans]MBF9073903.1 DNRLRE domain-containing protein [Streptacidiphilus fuscans]
MGIRHARLAAPGRPLGRRIGGIVAAALVAAPLSAIAPAAAHADGPPVTITPEAAALAQAHTTGKSVPVAADNTQNSTTVANPDGTLTYTDSPVPVQVDQGGTWVPVDATLQQNSNGGLSPRAATSSVTFSGGGSGPLATLTNPQGQQFSISWPASLPTPSVSGATATYASVYPGVDLQMTAQIDGGYTEHLVVKNATAAANPALQNIQLTTSVSSGLTLGKNAAGGVQATDASGNAVFSSPTPTMWDSAAPQGGSTSSPSPSPSPSASGATAAVRSLAVASGTPSTGTSMDDANPVTDLGVTVSGDNVDIVPPAGSLTASTNTYPLVIDPSVSPSTGSTDGNGWTWVSSVNSGTSYWEGSNNTNDTDAHVGYDDWCSNGTSGCTAFGVTRSMFEFPMNGLAGKHVTGATLSMTEQGPTSAWTGSNQIDLYGGGAISSGTTWNNQNVWPTVSASANFPSINSNTTGNANFDVTSLVQQAVANGYQNQTMVLQAHNESDDTAYRYLIGDSTSSNHPALEVTYWSTPNLPTNLSITNTGDTTACDTTAPGTWIDKNDASTVTLNADLTGPDTGYAETSDFWWHQVAPTNTSPWTDLKGPTITAQSTPQRVSVTPAGSLSDGDEYQWQVYAQSGSGGSGSYSSAAAPSGSSCYFRTDFTPPTVSVSSSAPPTTAGAAPGSLNLTATDPGTDPSGIAKINYNIDGTSINSGGSGELPVTASTASIKLPATSWGTHVVWYQAVDNAGNESAPQHFDYYVAEGAFTPGTHGDLTGDGKPDLATVDSSGDLMYYSDPFVNNPNGTGAKLMPGTKAPGGSSFTGALIAHQGSFSGQTCDDLVVVQGAQAEIDTQNQNCTPGGAWSTYPQIRPTISNPPADYNSSDWSWVKQIAVLPPASSSGKPSLLTVEENPNNGDWTLWMYTGGTDTFTRATLLSTSSYWSHVTIMSPGLINGTPALWVRDTSNGSLGQVQNIETWNNQTAPSATTFATSGFRVAQYPAITTDGPADNAGPTLWATNKTGELVDIPTSVDTTTGNVTLQNPITVGSPGWAANVASLEGVKPIHPTSTIGLYRSSTNTFIFDTANNSTTVDHTLTLTFAQAGDIPVTGDWSGTGVNGVGVYRPSNSTFYLDDSNTVSEIDHTIALGDSGDEPVVGDWNGDGITTVGVYRPSNEHFYLDDSLTSSNVDHVVWYGDTGDVPVVGDWTGTGTTSVGVYRPSTWQFIPATSLTNTTALTTQTYGTSGDTPITGDWTGSGSTGIGVWRSSTFTFYLDNSVTSGTTNQSQAFGVSTDTPVTGDWTGM